MIFIFILKEPSTTDGSMKEGAEMALKKLLNGSEDVNTESNGLKAQLEKLLVAYQTRETQFTTTVAEIKDKYACIVKEATDKADNILAKAQKTAEESAKTVAESLAASRKVAAEELKTTTEKNKKLVADATAQSASILATSAKERAAWEEEKALVADIQKFKPVVKVNVGGTKFTTSLATLCRFPNTMIGAMYSGRHELVQDDEGYHFIDRDGTHFRYILNFLRAPESFKCELTGAALTELKSECDYYGLKKLMFPFTPLPPFKTRNSENMCVTVSQDQSGVYKVGDIAVRVCPRCDIGDYSNPKVKRDRFTNSDEDYIQNFSTLVDDRDGAMYKSQPKIASPCRECRK